MGSPRLIVSLIFLSFFTSALSASVVTRLPGFQGPLPFFLETGYVEVDKESRGEWFHYFVESENEPREDPLLLWLTGGPRCSAFSGLVFEVGPLRFVTAEYNGSLPSLVYNPHSWTKVSNVTFLDSPLGSGFSYSRKYEAYDANDTSWSQEAYKFLLQWIIEHPQFISNPLYISGDSYAGKIAPIVAKRVMDGIDEGKEPLLNLQAIKSTLILNCLIYAHNTGIISDDLFENTQRSCRGQDYRSPSNSQCEMYLNLYKKFYQEINKIQILEMKCIPEYPDKHLHPRVGVTSGKRSLKEKHHLHQPPAFPDLRCRTYAYVLCYYWANSDIVRKALNIKQGTIREWVRCNYPLPYTKESYSSINYHLELLQRGYRALVYSGDHDLVIPFSGTKQWIKSLNSSILEDWRSWHVDGQVVGYTTTYSNNLTFATVKGAGHTAPEYKPRECLAMFSRWISHAPL